MNDGAYIYDSSISPWTANPASWYGLNYDMYNSASKTISFQLLWTDLFLNWHIWVSNVYTITASPTYAEEITATYRAVDPTFIDPALGDPASIDFVAIQNPPGKYVSLSFDNANWGGAAPSLKIIVAQERYTGY